MLLLGLGVLLGVTARAAADEEVAANAAIEDADDDDGTDETALIGAETDAIEPEDAEAVEASAVLRHSEQVAGFADAGERFGDGLRQRQPPRWGRLEVAIAWRRRLDEAAATAAAAAGSSRRDELWLLATWSR